MIRCRTLGILTGYIMCTSMCCVSIFIKITFKNNWNATHTSTHYIWGNWHPTGQNHHNGERDDRLFGAEKLHSDIQFGEGEW